MCKSQPSTHGQLTGVYDLLTLRRPFPLKPGPWSPNIKILAGTAPLDPLRRPYSPTSRPSSALNCRRFFFFRKPPWTSFVSLLLLDLLLWIFFERLFLAIVFLVSRVQK